MKSLALPLAAPLAFVAGAIAALGFEPTNLWLLTIAGVAVLVALVDTAVSRRRAALVGWCWGVGHFAFGLGWIAKAFTFQAKMPAALGWGAVAVLALFLALYVAAAAGAAAFARPGAPRLLVFGATFMAAEALRGVLLSGFPWNPLGSAWMAAPGVVYLAAWVGALGLSGLMLVAGGTPWLLLAPRHDLATRSAGLGLALLMVVAGSIGGGLNRETYLPDNSNVFIVQANIGEDERYGRDAANLAAYLALTRGALARRNSSITAGAVAQDVGGDFGNADGSTGPIPPAPAAAIPPTGDAGVPGTGVPGTGVAAAGGVAAPTATRAAVVVWPEGAVQQPVEDNPELRARLASALGPDDLLMFGGTGLVRDAGGKVVALANSLFVLDSRGRLQGRYDKSHLVPMGEYVPARAFMESIGIARLVPGDYDFHAGPGPRSLKLPGLPPVGPLVCYEVIFAGAIVDPRNRPAWLANLSNDAWYGASGPPQHLAQARLRAIEEGLPIIRSTPTGISAVVDPHGNIVAQQPLATQGVVAATLPTALPPTLYARQDYLTPLWLGLLLLALGLGPGFAAGRRRAAAQDI